ncbi:MAG: hypothetical protein E6J89_16240 [Deltaproteobacteria bacterium]|nr:MAG: hypothetical protein E6J89_16240 [Deltaproteobacteria bacterium]
MRRKRVCFVGYGSTEYSRKSEASVLWYYSEAIRQALRQTGLHKNDIQGFSVTTQVSTDYSPHVAEQLGLEVDWVLNGDYGGAGGVMSVRRAADAIEAGHVDLIVLVGGNSFDKSIPQQRPLEYQRANYVDVYGYGEQPHGVDSAAPHDPVRHDPRTDRQDRHGAERERAQ